MAISTSTTDVVVIGGGPAGATTSTLISQKRYRVRLFEREKFPRFHIGESLIPETYWVLQRLTMLDKLRASHFVKKFSVQFVNAQGKLSAPFYFHDNKPHECSQTWQVVRSEFDLMMLRNAQEQGVEVRIPLDILRVGPAGFGALQAASSLGAISMALLTTHLPPFKKAGRTLLWAVAGFGLTTIVFGLSRNFWLSLLMLFLTGAFDNISVVIRQTLATLATPDVNRVWIASISEVQWAIASPSGVRSNQRIGSDCKCEKSRTRRSWRVPCAATPVM